MRPYLNALISSSCLEFKYGEEHKIFISKTSTKGGENEYLFFPYLYFSQTRTTTVLNEKGEDMKGSKDYMGWMKGSSMYGRLFSLMIHKTIWGKLMVVYNSFLYSSSYSESFSMFQETRI